ncbi:MAG: aminotransferase class I/II-fold pyridoxal phosphate-dependent enzyme, partial [Bacteroidetes bacterium]|nr:aminotransferase class I/II-fold pyridoxal phosphate-dependent enzyme [Bacteroidota bacterium]
ADAEVGDDVFGEDPTINRLQERVADLLGKEAAIYVPSGTMSNQLALKTHTNPGDEVIVEKDSHIFNYELAAPSLLSGIQLNPVPGKRGLMTAQDVEDAIRPDVYYMMPTRLVCVENTHNRGGGSIYPMKLIEDIKQVTARHNLKYHLDGARLWNASIATGIKVSEYAKHFDSVSVCLSKGLGAPVGSVLTGTREYVNRVRRFRKIFGGGMRQAGILAAAGLYALEYNFQRLAEDHEKAKVFARILHDSPQYELNIDDVETNIVIFTLKPPITMDKFLADVKSLGVLLSAGTAGKVRAVTHLDVSIDNVKKAAEILVRYRAD